MYQEQTRVHSSIFYATAVTSYFGIGAEAVKMKIRELGKGLFSGAKIDDNKGH